MADFHGRRLLVFRVADLVCAAEATAVREILPARPATRIPGASASVAGLINIRGELMPLVHGARLVGRDADANEGSMLLLTVGGRSVGMMVDEVVDLVAAGEDDLADRDELPGIDPRLVRAVGQRDGHAFLVLDLDALFGPILSG